MNQIQQLLHRSIEIYQNTLDITVCLVEDLHTYSHDELRQTITTLQGLQEDAEQVDTLLTKNSRDASSHTRDLFTKRQEIIKKLIKQNKLLSPRIHGMMAVITSELSQIKTGKTAMTGYRSFSDQEKRGQHVCHSS